MSWFGNVLGFEKFHTQDLLKNVWEHPQRLLTGVDPISTRISNAILGRQDKPLVDQMGGATGDDYRKAEAAGIDTSAGKGLQNVAHVVAALAAAGYGASALGGAGAGGAAGAGAEAGAGAGTGIGSVEAGWGGAAGGGAESAGGAAESGGGLFGGNSFPMPSMGGQSQQQPTDPAAANEALLQQRRMVEQALLAQQQQQGVYNG